jgi:dynein light intermediate chain, axonemal
LPLKRTDELIRQITLECAERGLLLLRVRDEIRMTIAAYQTLYESSVAFGMRKALQAEQGKADMELKVRKAGFVCVCVRACVCVCVLLCVT